MIAVGAGGCFQNATYGNARVATGVWLRTMAGAGVPSEGWTSADPPGPAALLVDNAASWPVTAQAD